jgi:hypothetical protein
MTIRGKLGSPLPTWPLLDSPALSSCEQNCGERTPSDLDTGRTLANYSELKLADLKTIKVQAFGGSNPSPSARF